MAIPPTETTNHETESIKPYVLVAIPVRLEDQPTNPIKQSYLMVSCLAKGVALNYRASVAASIFEVPDTKAVMSVPPEVSYRIDPDRLPSVLVAEHPTRKIQVKAKGTNDTETTKMVFAGAITPKRYGINIDKKDCPYFELEIFTSDGKKGEYNAYTILKMIAQGMYFDTVFKTGSKGNQRHTLMLLPRKETSGEESGEDSKEESKESKLDLVIFDPMDITGSEATFKAEIETLIKDLVRLDESEEMSEDGLKLGLRSVLQAYPEMRNINGFGQGMRNRLRIQAHILPSELELFLDNVSKLNLSRLREVAGKMADKILESPAQATQLQLQLLKQELQPPIISDTLYPPAIIKQAAQTKITELTQTNGGLMAEIAKLNQTITESTGYIEVLEAQRRDLAHQYIEALDRVKEAEKLRDSVPNVSGEIAQLNTQLEALNLKKADLTAEISRQNEAFKREITKQAQLEAEYYLRLQGAISRTRALVPRTSEAERRGDYEGSYTLIHHKGDVVCARANPGDEVTPGWYIAGVTPDGKYELVKALPGDTDRYVTSVCDVATIERLNVESYSPNDIPRATNIAEFKYIISKIPDEQFRIVNEYGIPIIHSKTMLINIINNIVNRQANLQSLTANFELRSTLEHILQESNPQLLSEIKNLPGADIDEIDLRTQLGLINYLSKLDSQGIEINGYSTMDIARLIVIIDRAVYECRMDKKSGHPINKTHVLNARGYLKRITRGSYGDSMNPREVTVLMLINEYGQDLVYEIFGSEILYESQRD